MSGLFLALGLALLAAAAIMAMARAPLRLMAAPAAALMLGLAGYAWQGRAELAGHPVDAGARASAFDEQVVERRRALSDRLGPSNKWLILSDGLARQGSSEDAANILVSGLKEFPRDQALWVGLGNALVLHGEGAVSPAASYAFDTAQALEPRAVAPRFFKGLALARSGQLQPAKATWLALLRDLPEASPMRFELARNLVVIDRMQAAADGAGAPSVPEAEPPR